jgi:acyl transferase domain-containing protein/acyl carrier protein
LEPIAIIGISGVFPGAGDIDELWENLLNGRGCITEIPKTRWSWEEYYGDPVREANKTNIKWGGFIDGVDKFDPVFFGVSPREAAFMDPQQRLMMTHIWKAIEDAGYSAQSLSGSKTAIFMGTGNSGYSELLSRANVTIEGYSSTGMVPSVGPNRMSYFLNIHGPSEPVETACSSSLVAIHRAVCAIREGTCDMAAAGGVNTILTPDLHISFNKAGMLVEDGRCKTFSDKANGYVRGEGAGVVLLKKLKDAERDGDHIYGVILSTAENHGGRANSLTAPNPKAQAELLVSAYQRAGIHPGTVSYIEAHGTGTELGDPIEINGLKTAFKELYRTTGDSEAKENHCGLGSIKTNIGHLELAAGIAGVIKVLLQMKHKTLVKSLYCDTVNPYIQLQDSPFYIARKTKEWESLKDEQGRDIPRRAGVSSFGFGGVNAHVVMEEYVPKVKDGSKLHVSVQGAAIIVLSAKNEERLKERAAQLLCAINDGKIKEDCLTDMAYTLQIGRDAMEERLAMLVESLEDLAEKLKSFVDGREGIPGLYRGQMKHNKNTISVFEADEEMQEAVEKWIKRGKFDKLMDLWVRGLNFDWNKLYGNAKPSRISLPTYPFARERYWVPEDRIKKTGKPDNNAAGERLDSFGVSIDRKSGILGYSETSGKPEGISLQLLSDYEAIPAEPPEPIQEPSALTPSRNTASLQKNSTIPELDVHISANTINKLAEVEFKEAVHVRPEVHEKAKASGNTQLLQALRDELTESLAKALYMDSSQVDKDKKFVEMGLDSIVGVEWIRDINKKYGTSIAATKVYDYPTIREFAEFLQRELDGQERGPVKVSAKPAGPLSVDELLRQVQQGALDVGNASQLLSKLNV